MARDFLSIKDFESEEEKRNFMEKLSEAKKQYSVSGRRRIQ
jgi:hypothetical protein